MDEKLRIDFGSHKPLVEGDRLVISIIQRQGSYNKDAVPPQRVLFDRDVGYLVFDCILLGNHPPLPGVEDIRVTKKGKLLL